MTIRELNLNALDLSYAGLRVRRPMAEKRLMASLGERGQQSPVVVVAGSEAGRYVVIDGHKRVRALSRLKADVVKAAVWEMPAVDALVAAYQGACGTGWNAVEEKFEQLKKDGRFRLLITGLDSGRGLFVKNAMSE